jgi:putative heme-binding domain-containing protein
VVAAFNKAFDPAAAASLIDKRIPFFPLEPATGRRGNSQPLGSLRIAGARLTDDNRTLILATDPHPLAARYFLPLEANGGRREADRSRAKQTSYDLSGVEVVWSKDGNAGAQPEWTGWWPEFDFEATRRLTKGSRPHELGFELFSKPGRLVLASFVRLREGSVILRIETNQSIEEATFGDATAAPNGSTSPGARHNAELRAPCRGEPIFLTMTLHTGSNDRPFSLTVSYRNEDEKSEHRLEREQLIVPWAPLPASSATAPMIAPDLSGGDAVRGQAIYNGEQARCSQCHTFRGKGGTIGPDLTDVGKKGRAEIYRAIAAPSAVIEPDYVTYTVAMKDGQATVGIVRSEGSDSIRITDASARTSVVARNAIELIRPSANSIMPVGLTGVLGDAAVRDLIAFLTSPALSAKSSQK